MIDKNTLKYHQTMRPGTSRINVSEYPLANYTEWAKKTVKSKKKFPEDDALVFYTANHVVSQIALDYADDEPLPEKVDHVVSGYHRAISDIGIRMFGYLLITTSREARHCSLDRLCELEGSSEHKPIYWGVRKGDAAGLYKEAENHPEIKVGPYLDWLCDVYFKLPWSASYGGPAWGKITKVLRDFVYGDISMEMMLDTAFTLAHNNGPVFNKGFQYQGYHEPSLSTILDCQRAGEVPFLIKSGKKFCRRIAPGHTTMIKRLESFLGITFRPWVNWRLVAAFSLSKSSRYYQFYDIAKNDYGHDDEFQECDSKVNEIVAHLKKKELAKKIALQAKVLEISPGVYVNKSERK